MTGLPTDTPFLSASAVTLNEQQSMHYITTAHCASYVTEKYRPLESCPAATVKLPYGMSETHLTACMCMPGRTC